MQTGTRSGGGGFEELIEDGRGGGRGSRLERIRDRRCGTCIYRPDSALREELPRLEDEARDPDMPGHFSSWRECHSEPGACCAGFADKHGDRCTPVQMMRRIDEMRRSAAERMEPNNVRGRRAAREGSKGLDAPGTKRVETDEARI